MSPLHSSKRKAIIVDIDGTVALRQTTPGSRKPFDWDRVDEDIPNQPVIDTIHALETYWRYTTDFIYITGRPESCRPETEDWLKAHDLTFDELHMRTNGDWDTKDYDMKSNIYEFEVKPYYDVRLVLEDRNSVVEMWRNKHNLTCFQVGFGDF